MRFQMHLSDAVVAHLRAVAVRVKKNLDDQMSAFEKTKQSKMMAAALKNETATVEKLNRQQQELAEMHNVLTETNILRVAMIVGFEDMKKWSAQKIFDALEEHGVVRGRPRGA